MLCQRATQIAIGELLAVCLAFGCFPHVLKSSSAIAFVDNMSVIHIAVNGAAKHADLSSFTHALHHRIALLNTDVWWEYVPSASNIADGGSRVGVACDMAAAKNIPLREIPFLMPPASFPMSHPDDWSVFWHVHV